jgi:proline iminopeptidase
MKRVTPILCLAFISITACLDPNEEGNLVPATVDGDPSLPRVELNGSMFHAETFGDPSAPVIVMLHGGPGGSYGGMLRLRDPVDGVRLEDKHFLVFWDQRGAGLSRRHDPSEIKKTTYDADLLAVIDRYSPGRPVVLVGHSWGGMYATMFIAQHPDRVAGAVLMDSGPFTGALFEEVKGGIMSLDLWSEWLNDTTWGQSIVSPDGHARLDYIRMLGSLGDSQAKYHLPKTDRPISWRIGAVANGALMEEGMSADGKAVWDFTKGLERFDRPVLFEGAELNQVIGAEFQKRQMTSYRNARLEVIVGAGHEHQWTHPQETLRPVFNYLSSIAF